MSAQEKLKLWEQNLRAMLAERRAIEQGKMREHRLRYLR